MICKKIDAKMISLFLTFFLFPLSLGAKMFLGSVIFPVEVSPSLCLYYKGQKLLVDGQKDEEYKTISFSLDEASYVQQLHILICLEPSCFSEHNNIKYLTVDPTQPYKLYSLRGARTFDAQGEEVLSWDVQEEKLEDSIIPDNTLIVVYNPELVEGLQVVSWRTKDQIRILPNIVMKKQIKKDVFIQAMNIARLSAMDLDSYHEQASTRSMHEEQAVARVFNRVKSGA